jgi:hypothetical protein
VAARERMTPAATAVLEAVTAKIALSGIERDQVQPVAEAVTAVAAALIQISYGDGNGDPSETLRRLTPIWHQLVS